MIISKDVVIAQGLELSEAHRLDVIERLAESLSGAADVVAAWDKEIDRRFEDIEARRATFAPWEEARRRIASTTNAFALLQPPI